MNTAERPTCMGSLNRFNSSSAASFTAFNIRRQIEGHGPFLFRCMENADSLIISVSFSPTPPIQNGGVKIFDVDSRPLLNNPRLSSRLSSRQL